MQFPVGLSASRRRVVVGAALGLLTAVVSACSTSGRKPAESSSSDAGAEPAPGAALAKTTDVPVGSGVIVGDTVVTQPTAGAFTGLSATCTHAGCTVSEIQDAEIVCPCHGSRFNLDGTVARGPATQPLEARRIDVRGGEIYAG
ncbi:ubiquinol-cytochrome c reductase iron-sulfur subunit [Mycobacterium sp. WMMD1722]|uniref:QcrA and Rieske domain-containing protein n=1 Tax=Mycobacterium sp. WMMD1722 TaxID=3404117 RepID=UPI003BF57BBD